ncbi:MAG: hypothetical protein ACI4SG_08450 [Oligosphaeraceae bacterium]
MPFQFLVRHHGDGDLASLFARGKCREADSLPLALGAKEGLPEGAALTFREEGGGIVVENGGVEPVQVEGQSLPAGASRRLSLGGAVVAGEREVRLYRLHGRPGTSWVANALGIVALAGVVLSLFLEAGVCLGLGGVLMRSPAVLRQQESQALTSRVDQLRRRLRSRETQARLEKDPLASAYLDALQEEMERRVAYLRRYGDRLTSGERKAQMENLNRLDQFLDQLEANPSLTPPPASVEVDDPVRALIETP